MYFKPKLKEPIRHVFFVGRKDGLRNVNPLLIDNKASDCLFGMQTLNIAFALFCILSDFFFSLYCFSYLFGRWMTRMLMPRSRNSQTRFLETFRQCATTGNFSRIVNSDIFWIFFFLCGRYQKNMDGEGINSNLLNGGEFCKVFIF